MVQIASLISAVIVAIAPAHAWRCTFGVDYCGATLTKYGKKKNPSAWCETTNNF